MKPGPLPARACIHFDLEVGRIEGESGRQEGIKLSDTKARELIAARGKIRFWLAPNSVASRT